MPGDGSANDTSSHAVQGENHSPTRSLTPCDQKKQDHLAVPAPARLQRGQPGVEHAARIDPSDHPL
jgi:hypothetical protein